MKERREDKGGVGKGRGNVGRSKHPVLCSATRLTLLDVTVAIEWFLIVICLRLNDCKCI